MTPERAKEIMQTASAHAPEEAMTEHEVAFIESLRCLMEGQATSIHETIGLVANGEASKFAA